MAEKYKYRKTKIILLLRENGQKKETLKTVSNDKKVYQNGDIKVINCMKNYYYLREQETDTLHIQYM